MSDLISRSALKEAIEDGRILLEAELVHDERVLKAVVDLTKKIEKFIDETIDAQTTAYDVDKVVAGLEVLLDLVNMNQKLAVCQAIEIVRKGGIE